MTRDIRNTPVSMNEAAPLELYEKALRQLQGYVGDPVALIDEALALRPDFVLGHAFRAGLLMTFSERRFANDARTNVERAEALTSQANQREKDLVGAARLLVDGDWHGACAAYDHVLVDHPRDVFALQLAHLFDFFRGDSLNLRNRVSRVLPHWSPSVPGYSFVLGMHAFGLEECNQYEQAEESARSSLSLEPKDVWAVHAGVHCMEMQGRIEDGIGWLETKASDWAPDNSFAYHNWWHLALLHLDRERYERVLELYDSSVYPERSDFSLQLVDATALLFRLHLLGQNVDSRMQELATVWESKLDGERGFYAFNDAHAMMALAVAGREAAVRTLLEHMEAAAKGTTTNAQMTREVGLPVARALLAFARGRHAEVIATLEPVRDIAHRFGGSHAQRDLLTLTLIQSALRTGIDRLARHYLAERRVHRPASALGWRLGASTGA